MDWASVPSWPATRTGLPATAMPSPAAPTTIGLPDESTSRDCAFVPSCPATSTGFPETAAPSAATPDTVAASAAAVPVTTSRPLASVRSSMYSPSDTVGGVDLYRPSTRYAMCGLLPIPQEVVLRKLLAESPARPCDY